MKTTTETNKFAKVLSYIIAFLIIVVSIVAINFLPKPADMEKVEGLMEKPKLNKKEAKEFDKKKLPEKFAEKLVNQSEVLVRKRLKEKIFKFQEMSEKMNLRKKELLDRIDQRKTLTNAPKDANDTRKARRINTIEKLSDLNELSVEDMYNLLADYETEIKENHLASKAAELALTKGQSFPIVYDAMKLSNTSMVSYDSLVSKVFKIDTLRNSRNYNIANEVQNTEDLNNYRSLLQQATREVGLADSRLTSFFTLKRKTNAQSGSKANNTGEGSGNGGMAVNFQNQGKKTPMNYYQGARLNQEEVKAQALPGRRFSESSDRKGWLYVNTWYMIGPWDNYGRDDFGIIHPPELSVDLDAVYYDGLTGNGIVETESDPLKIIGEEIQMDGTLRWKFMQSSSMHNTVPVTSGHSTYYAYTELYFDESVTMLVAIGTDDSGRLWINNKDVWKDIGTSWYHIDENIQLFNFQQGWNKIYHLNRIK